MHHHIGDLVHLRQCVEHDADEQGRLRRVLALARVAVMQQVSPAHLAAVEPHDAAAASVQLTQHVVDLLVEQERELDEAFGAS